MILFTRQDLEAKENLILQPYAVKAGESAGREFSEPEPLHRTAFQRDIDRIVHSKAFRRLEYKTQVFVNYEGDHYRTRLTHTFEVARVAHSLSRPLGLNTDLVEAIALAHDLGHTPFGHAGEEVLNEIMQAAGGFEHNRQSLRVVEEIESLYPTFRGLNLTWEVREGLLKHASIYDHPDIDRFDPHKRPSMEAQIVNLADEIAYNCHDLEDGLRAAILRFEDFRELDIWNSICQKIESDNLPEDMLRYQSVRYLKDFLVNDALNHSVESIRNAGIKTIEDVRNHPSPLIEWSPDCRRQCNQLSKFLLKKFYFHHRLVRMTTKARWMLKNLFALYKDQPSLLPEKIQFQMRESHEPMRIICDYVAGMTDRFALDEYRKLADPSTGF
jgi:dGTPase